MRQRIVSLLLAALVWAALAGCSGGGEGSGAAVDREDLQAAMLAADDTLPEMLSITDEASDAAEKFPYLSDFPYEKLEGFLLSYSADGKLADEIAVLAVKDPADVDQAAGSLREHQDSRLKLYQTYGPEQAGRVEQGQVFTEGRYAVLIICDNADAVKEAFHRFLSDAEKG